MGTSDNNTVCGWPDQNNGSQTAVGPTMEVDSRQTDRQTAEYKVLCTVVCHLLWYLGTCYAVTMCALWPGGSVPSLTAKRHNPQRAGAVFQPPELLIGRVPCIRSTWPREFCPWLAVGSRGWGKKRGRGGGRETWDALCLQLLPSWLDLEAVSR